MGATAQKVSKKPAPATAWPTKPVRILVGFPGGSTPDMAARTLAEPLSRILGQPVIIENKPGASGNIAADQVAKATDDHTLGVVINGNLTSAKLLNPKLPYDPAKDFTLISLLTTAPLVMVVNPSLGVKTLKDYLLLTKNLPQNVTFASGGAGSVTQLLGVKINLTTGLSVQEIPYKAIGAELPDLLAGHVVTAYLAPVVVAQHIRSGKLVALGVAGSRRIASLPDVPTLAEAGLPDVEASGWNGLFVPAGTPKAVVQRLYAETTAIMATPSFRAEALSLGYELGGEASDEFAAYIKAEVAKWGKVIRDGKIKVE